MNSNLPVETKKLLERYLDAAANLYGIVPLSKILKIYNSQNEPIAENVFLQFVDDLDLSHKYYYIIGEDEFHDDVDIVSPIERDIVAEHIVMEDRDPMYYQIKEGQFGKPYFVPEKEKLLKYEDSLYIEKTLSFISFRAFLRNQSYLTKEKADEIAEEICSSANVDNGSIDDAIKTAEFLGFKFTNSNMSEFIRLFTDMFNDTRLHINCGHTPNEMYKI